jgi:hypothetical protein
MTTILISGGRTRATSDCRRRATFWTAVYQAIDD